MKIKNQLILKHKNIPIVIIFHLITINFLNKVILKILINLVYNYYKVIMKN